MIIEEPSVDVLEEHEGRVVRLVLDAPPDNAIDLRLLNALQTRLTAISGWPEVCCVVIEGSGRDISVGFAPNHRRPPYVSALVQTFHATVRQLASLDAILVGRVKGRCQGAGAELVLLCDAIFADSGARFSFPEVGLASFSPVASLLLAERIGQTRAREWLLSGRSIPADEAVATGLVTQASTGWENLETITRRFLESVVLPRSGVGLRGSSRAFRQTLLKRLNDDLGELEEHYLQHIVPSHDFEEAMDAAQEKREPRWKHR